MQGQNKYLDYLIDPRFDGVNTLFVLSFEDNVHQTSYFLLLSIFSSSCRYERLKCYDQWAKLFSSASKKMI